MYSFLNIGKLFILWSKYKRELLAQITLFLFKLCQGLWELQCLKMYFSRYILQIDTEQFFQMDSIYFLKCQKNLRLNSKYRSFSATLRVGKMLLKKNLFEWPCHFLTRYGNTTKVFKTSYVFIWNIPKVFIQIWFFSIYFLHLTCFA